MKNKTIKKLTKGIVAIALTIATVVGAGVIGAQEYNAYTTKDYGDYYGIQVVELNQASNNSSYSPGRRNLAMWCSVCYTGGEEAQLMLKQVGATNPNATGEDGVAQYVIKNPNTHNTGDAYMDSVETVVLGNGLCLNYVEQFRADGDIHPNYQLPAKYAAAVQNTASTSTTMIDNFDATFYANMYPDVKKAIGTDATKLYNHYVTYGKAEGRYANQAAYNAAHKSK